MSHKYSNRQVFLWMMSLLAALSLLPAVVQAAPTQQRAGQVVMDVFWGTTCGHCRAQKPFLRELEQRYPRLKIREYEVYESQFNRDIFSNTAKKHNVQANGVPAVFVGGQAFFGNSLDNQKSIEATVVDMLESLPAQKIETAKEDTPPKPVLPAEKSQSDTPVTPPITAEATPSKLTTVEEFPEINTQIEIPFFGTFDIKESSILVSTLLISFVDGFNPCSIWVLTLLLGMVLNSGSRRRIITVGVVFLVTTATIYGAFIAGVFKVMSLFAYLVWIQWIVALFAFIFGIVNIKDFFWFKKGFSFTIADSNKPGIYRSIRGLMNPEAQGLALVFMTVVMAAGISLVELPCTAGFPVMWSALMRTQHISGLEFFSYLLVYLFVYLSIEIVFFLVAVFTMKMSRFEESYGQSLKLIGGMIMVALAFVLVLKPDLMNSIKGMIWIFGGAFLLAFLIISGRRFFQKQSQPPVDKKPVKKVGNSSKKSRRRKK